MSMVIRRRPLLVQVWGMSGEQIYGNAYAVFTIEL